MPEMYFAIEATISSLVFLKNLVLGNDLTQCGIVRLSTGRPVLVYKPILCKRRMRPQLGAAYQPSEATNSKFIRSTPLFSPISFSLVDLTFIKSKYIHRTSFHTSQKVKSAYLKDESGRFATIKQKIYPPYPFPHDTESKSGKFEKWKCKQKICNWPLEATYSNFILPEPFHKRRRRKRLANVKSDSARSRLEQSPQRLKTVDLNRKRKWHIWKVGAEDLQKALCNNLHSRVVWTKQQICKSVQTICTLGRWVTVDQSVSLVERCHDLIAKQTVLPPSQPPSSFSSPP